jgi:hypothetical protein
MANWIPTENALGIQPIAQSNIALPSQYQVGQSPLFGQAHPLGTIVRATDATLGGGEFIYLKGVAGTVVGSLVTYDPVNATTALVPNTAGQNNPLAVAMSANVAGQFGWYQIAGAAVIKKTAVKINPASKLWISATTGRVFATSTAGKAVWNCITVNAATVASATSTITALIQRPFAEQLAI